MAEMNLINEVPADVAPAQSFLEQFKTWRATLPGWQKLIQAIRKDKPFGELLPLASEAGILSRNELLELVEIRRRAVRDQEVAKGAPKYRKRLAELDAEVERLQKAVEAASAADYAAALAALEAATVARHRCFTGDHSEPAANFIETVAKPMGLI